MRLHPGRLGLPSVTALRTINAAARHMLSLDSLLHARIHYGHKVRGGRQWVCWRWLLLELSLGCAVAVLRPARD